MRCSPFRVFMVLLFAGLLQGSRAEATTIIAFYGDDDGFGIGATTTLNPSNANAGLGEAPFTDTPLIGNQFSAPAFAPTGGFSFSFPAGETIVSATLTMRAGAWNTLFTPVDPPNVLLLDGLAIPASFFSQFVLNTGNESTGSNFIETRSIGLSPGFFAALADGSVSLNGTHLSEGDGAGSFQIDFLRLQIETTADNGPGPGPGPVPVPEPATMWLLLSGVARVATWRRTGLR